MTTTKAYVITGPTSGMGRATAFELAKHGKVVLVGRDRAKLDAHSPHPALRSGVISIPGVVA